MALRKVYNQFLNVFTKLTLIQRVAIGAATLAVLVTLVSLVVWANRPVYRTLYSELAREDTNKIAESLKKKNIPYEIPSDDTVTVPQEYVYQARLDLAKEGLPTGGGTGFELFDKNAFGMTEFMQDVNYVRALQGELSRTISQMDEIKEAKVHLSIPKERLFVSNDAEVSKASVVVRMQPNTQITQENVRAISFLVSGAVKGLKPENVQVLDTAGNLLSDFLQEDRQPLVMSAGQHEYQKKIERDLEAKITYMLASTLGEGRAVAKVTAEMDFNKVNKVVEDYGDTPVLRSSHTLEINSKNTPKGPGGVPGVESNLAEPDLLDGEALSEYNKAEETTNFEIDKTVTTEERKTGIIKRMTVAVVVDDRITYTRDNATETDKEVRTPRSEEDMARIKNLVSMAVGLNPDRGDAIEVSNISFDTTMEQQENKLVEKQQLMELVTMLIKYGIALAILLVFYFLIIRPILRRIESAHDIDEASLGESALDAQLQAIDLTVGDEAGFPKSVDEIEREIEAELEGSTPVDVETVKSKVMLKKIIEATNEDPELVGNLVKALIKGG